MKGCSLFLLLSILLPPAVAESDLSQPCFNGVCSSDVDQSPTSMGGTVVLSGSVDAISDITPIAGWEVLNCSSSAAPQTIRLVCTGDSTSCNHLFSNGAENTIVRLPLNCGSGPFAVVAKAAVSSDQSVPHNLSTRSIKRAANTPQVQDLSIHTNFSSITNSAHGEVAFAVVGTNIPGALQNITVAPNMDVNKTIGIFQALSFGPFNIDQEAALDPVSFQNTLTIVNEVLDCDSPEGFLEVSASVDCSIEASLAIVASGTIFPPVLNQFALSTTLEASFQGDVTADVSALGSFDSGQVTLTSLPIPGFEIAGIIDITPSLDMDARVVATLDIAADIGYSLPLNLQRIELVLPPSQGNSEASISAGPLEFEIISFPDTPADTSLKFDLIPTLNVDVLVLGLSTTPTNIFLNFDTGVTMDLDLEGSGFDGCVNVGVEVGSTVGVSGPFATLLGFGSGGTETLFQASKPNLFQQCLPATTSRSKRSNDSMELMTSDKSLIKRDLSCLPPDRSLPELLASATVVVF